MLVLGKVICGLNNKRKLLCDVYYMVLRVGESEGERDMTQTLCLPYGRNALPEPLPEPLPLPSRRIFPVSCILLAFVP